MDKDDIQWKLCVKLVRATKQIGRGLKGDVIRLCLSFPDRTAKIKCLVYTKLLDHCVDYPDLTIVYRIIPVAFTRVFLFLNKQI